MATWRIFMSPSREISISQEPRNHSRLENHQEKTKPTHIRVASQTNDHFKKMLDFNKQQNQVPTNKKKPFIQPKLNSNLKKQKLSTVSTNNTVSAIRKQQKRLQRDLSKSFENDLGFIQSDIDVYDAQNDINQIKTLMQTNTQILQTLTLKLDRYHKDQTKLIKDNINMSKKYDQFNDRLKTMEKVVFNQQPQQLQQQFFQQKRRSKSQLSQPILRRKVVDLENVKNNIRRALQEVYFEYLN